MIKDLTKGKPIKVICFFALPMVLSMAFQQLYNIADSVIVGQFEGQHALAAVGSSYPVTMLFIAIALGAGIGCSVIISQLFGIKALERMKTAIWTTLISILTLAVILTVVGYFVSAPIIKLLKTPSEIYESSLSYLNIYIGGLIFLFMYNAATSTFNALGDSRTPLYFLIFSSVLNVGLDLWFVGGLKMGVTGAAWATFIAQGTASCLAVFTLLFRISKIKTENKYKKFDFSVLKRISAVAIPSICQQSFISVGQLCVQSVVNSFGATTIAAYSAAMKVSILAISGFNTLSSAVSSYTAQNVGAGEDTRVKQGYKAGLLIAFCLCAVYMLLFLLLGKNLVGLFINSDGGAEVMAIGGKFLGIVALGYPLVVVKVITDGMLRGSGFILAFVISTFSDLIIRVGITLIFARTFGFTVISLSFIIGWVIGSIVSISFYLSGKWKNKVKV